MLREAGYVLCKWHPYYDKPYPGRKLFKRQAWVLDARDCGEP